MKWPVFSLPEVAEINPRRPSSLDLSDDSLVTFIPMPAVSEVTASIERPEIRTYVEVKKGFTYFGNDDVLLAKITPCMENGKSAIATELYNGVGFGSTEFHVIRANKKILLPKFFHYFIRQQSFRNLAKARMRGAVGQQRVPKDFLDDVKLPLPPLSEQRRIVEILDQADALRKKRAEADAKAARILPALFYKMFGDPATNPKGWPVRPLKNLFAEDKSAIEMEQGTSLPYLGLEHIESDTGRILIKEHEGKKIKIRGISFKFTNSHVLYSKLRPYLNKVALPMYDGRCSTELVPLLPLGETPREFVAAYLRLRFIVNAAMSSNKGSRMPRTDMTLLLNMSVPVPPMELQFKFAGAFRLNEQNQVERQRASTALARLFNILIHRAFAGDLTANWRKGRMKELLVEMEKQAKLPELNENGME
jgi:type I restriction enzyme, S subunit